jgi:hypothetical protein
MRAQGLVFRVSLKAGGGTQSNGVQTIVTADWRIFLRSRDLRGKSLDRKKTGLSAPIPQPACGGLAGFPLQSLARPGAIRNLTANLTNRTDFFGFIYKFFLYSEPKCFNL